MSDDDAISARVEEFVSWFAEDTKFARVYMKLARTIDASLIREVDLSRPISEGERNVLNQEYRGVSKSAKLLRLFLADLAEKEAAQGEKYGKKAVHGMISRWMDEGMIMNVTVFRR